ncbi:MAG: transposase [archaeon]|nr:transposase [archaeon]
MNAVKIKEVLSSQLEDLHKQILTSNLPAETKELMIGVLESSAWVTETINKKGMTMSKFRNLAGLSSEKKKNLKKDNSNKSKDKEHDESTEEELTDETDNNSEQEAENKFLEFEQEDDKIEEKLPNKGRNNGRNGADKYTGAKEVEIFHPDLQPGDKCIEALCNGKIYKYKNLVMIRVTGNGIASSTKYIVSRLRCNLCGEIYTPELPDDAKEEKYDCAIKANLCAHKYYLGLPFYRMERMQKMVGTPFPDATQWDLVKQVYEDVEPIHKAMEIIASNARLMTVDDTSIKILSVMKENKELDPIRKGMFTTGIIAESENNKIALFYSGRKYAAENTSALLSSREEKSGDLIQMSDALRSRNIPQVPEHLTIKMLICFCLVHGRRNFVELFNIYPKICNRVICEIAEIYKNEGYCKTNKFSKKKRFEYHQKHSKRVIERLYAYLQGQIDKKKVEPNSSIGKAILYMLRHKEELTQFLKIPGAPIDSNVVERALKIPIFNRKAAMFYRTEKGAAVGDKMMSIIYTCVLNDVNAIDYLIFLQKNKIIVAANPHLYLPWNYKFNLHELNHAA